MAGGFFAQKSGPTFRPKNQFRDADNDDDEEEDGYMGHSSSKSSPRRLRPRKTNGGFLGGKKGAKGRSGGMNDWDLLLPSTDAYDDEDDDEDDYEGLTENEKWKKKQLAKKGWESRRGQILILATLVTLATFVRIWKVAIPASVV